MVRYVITVDIHRDEINVSVSKDGRYYDEVSFHVSEICEFDEYMDDVVTKILREIMGKKVFTKR